MAQMMLNPFNHRQYMAKENLEIFHYNNVNSCACAPHRHSFYELYYLLGDCIDIIVDGLRYSLRPGSVMFVAPGQLHRPDVSGPVRDIDRFVLWLSEDYVRALTGAMPHLRYALLGDMTGRNLIEPDEETGEAMRQLLFALHREAGRGGPDEAQLCRSIVTQLLIYCGRGIARTPETLSVRAELRYHEVMGVYEHIVSHLRDELSVADLAEMFFMDKNTLTRQFKRIVGMTPGECIRRHRLETAHALIRDGAPMKQACAECGFSDYSAFYRAFRHAYGVNPSAYAARSRARGRDEDRSMP